MAPNMSLNLGPMMQCALAALLATSVASHGLMSWPRQRGAAGRNNYDMPHLDKDPGYVADDCPHCLNGGGKGVVQSHSKGMWVPFEPTYPDMPFRDDHEICGDPIGDNSHKVGGKYTTGMMLATYEDGDYMDMEIQINAHHNGYMEFLLCNMDACDSDDISKKCFQSGACEKLMRVPHKSCESGNDRICGPVDPAYPGRWILPPRNQDAPEDNWYGGTNKKMRYALPKGMVCEKCILNWQWVTANACNPEGFAEYKFPKAWDGIPGDGGSLGAINRQFGTCGSDKNMFPEEFWSCSEYIRIAPKNGGKDRTEQIFHGGARMNIEGPDSPGATMNMKPMKDPHTSYTYKGVKLPKKTEIPAVTVTPIPVVGDVPVEEMPETEQLPAQQDPIQLEPMTSMGPEAQQYDYASVGETKEEQRAHVLAQREKSKADRLQAIEDAKAVQAAANGATAPIEPVDIVEKAPTQVSYDGVDDYIAPPTSNESCSMLPGGSKYNVGKYLSAVDTGVCNGGYCEVCIDLKYGSSKCMWCNNSSCKHSKPE